MILDILSEYCKNPVDYPADSSHLPVTYDGLLPVLADRKLTVADIGPLYDPVYLPELNAKTCKVTFLTDGRVIPYSALKDDAPSEVLFGFDDIVNFKTGLIVLKTNTRLHILCRKSSIITINENITCDPDKLHAGFNEAAKDTNAVDGIYVADYLYDQHRFVFDLEIKDPENVLISKLEDRLTQQFGVKCTVYILKEGSFASHRAWRLSLGIPKELYTRPEVVTCISDRGFFRSHMDERF